MINEIMLNFYNAIGESSNKMMSFNDNFQFAMILLEVTFTVIYIGYMQPKDGLRKLMLVILMILVLNEVYAYFPNVLNILFNSVMELGNHITGNDIAPNEIFNSAFAFAMKLWALGNGSGLSDSIVNASLKIAVIFVTLMAFVLITAEILVLYIEFYIYASLGGLFFGFAMFKVTRTIFWNWCKSLLGKALKLLAIFIVLSFYFNINVKFNDISEDLILTKPTYGEGKYSSLKSTDCSSTFAFAGIEKTDRPALCETYEIEKNRFEMGVSDFFDKYGMLIFGAIVVIFIIFKTIPPQIAGIVGFGNYDIKGTGILGMTMLAAQRAKKNMTSNPVSNSLKSGVDYGANKMIDLIKPKPNSSSISQSDIVNPKLQTSKAASNAINNTLNKRG